MRSTLLFAVIAVSVAACAKNMDDIPASNVDVSPYWGLSCAALSAELNASEHTLAALVSSEQQYESGPQVASLEEKAGAMRGIRLTIRATMAKKKCP